MVRPIDLIAPPQVVTEVVPEGLSITRNVGFGPRRATMVLPITLEDYSRWQRKEGLMQDIFPDLSPDQREFMLSGITPEIWAETFPPEDEED